MSTGEAAVAGVVLAAGRGGRLAGAVPKPLRTVGGVPLVRRTLEVLKAADLTPLVVVVGHAEDEVERALADLDLLVVSNPRWSEGQSTSVRAGLGAVPPRASGVLFAPCDQPFLEAELLRRQIEAHRAGGDIVAPRWRGQPGAPVLFGRRWFRALDALRGDVGGRRLLRQYPTEVTWVEVDDPVVLTDVDTHDDLEAARDRAGQSS